MLGQVEFCDLLGGYTFPQILYTQYVSFTKYNYYFATSQVHAGLKFKGKSSLNINLLVIR